VIVRRHITQKPRDGDGMLATWSQDQRLPAIRWTCWWSCCAVCCVWRRPWWPLHCIR